MTDPSLWNQILIWPIMNLLVMFYKFSEWLQLPGPLGFAIIFLTIVMRLILYPLMQAQLKSAKKMAAMKPHIDALNAKHKDDKKALQQAQLDLYKEHGVNPAAGCLPLLVQFPVLIALYNVFYSVFTSGDMTAIVAQINQIVYSPALRLSTIDLSFFGVNLGIKPSSFQTNGWWLLSIPIITGLLQWYQTKLMILPSSGQVPSAASGQQTAGKNKSSGKKLLAGTEKPEEKKVDTAMEMQKQMAMITPIMFGYFALQFPLGLALYWNVFGLFGIMQQMRVNNTK